MLSRTSTPTRPPTPPGVALGRRIGGSAPLPVDRQGTLLWPFTEICKHALVLGASGTGKTETALRIAHQLALKTDYPIFYLDAKGDRANASRFCGLMAEMGRRPRVFPNQHFDAWRGDWRAIVNRLLEVIQFADSGPAAYYRDIAKTVLQLGCNHPDGPPRSSHQLLHRLDYESLLNAHGPTSAVLSLPRERVGQVRLRYQSFFGQLGARLDGDWSFEDADSAYLLLDSVALGEDTAGTASLLFADFAHFFTSRKDPDRPCLLFCDEFAAIASASDLALKVEQARSFSTALVLIPQTVGCIGDQAQRDRILGSVETVISHAVNEPDRIADLAGRRHVAVLNHRFDTGALNGAGTMRSESRPAVEADQVRRLPVGQAWLIRRGRAAHIEIERAPMASGHTLPEPLDPDPPLQPLRSAAPKHLSYLDESD